MGDDVAALGVDAGLCATCVHAILRPTRRGTTYLRCALAASEPSFPRYPQLPVRACTGHLEFRAGSSDEAPGRELLVELNALFNSQYEARVSRPGSVTTPDELRPPSGTFLVGYADGRPVAIGGLRRLEDGVCEIKRMYVVPDARSRGVGRALLAALEDAGRALGYGCVRLDAGPAQQHSRTLFESAGYREIARYNDNHIADYFAEKAL